MAHPRSFLVPGPWLLIAALSLALPACSDDSGSSGGEAGSGGSAGAAAGSGGEAGSSGKAGAAGSGGSEAGAGGEAGSGGAGAAGASGGSGQAGAGAGGGGAGGGGSEPEPSAFSYGSWHDFSDGSDTTVNGAWVHDGAMQLDAGECPFGGQGPESSNSVEVRWDPAKKLLGVRGSLGTATTVGFAIKDPMGPAQAISVDGIGCSNMSGSVQINLTGGSLTTENVTLDSFDPAAHSLKITYALSGKAANVSAIEVKGFIEVHK